jgi:hypothetical protein
MPDVLAAWTSHPAKNRPRDLALLVAVVAVTAAAVLMSFESVFLALLAVVILMLAVAPFWLPTRYTVTDEEIVSKRIFTSRSRRWRDLRRVEVGGNVALLTPFARPTWLDRYRGMMVYLDGAPDREGLIKILRARVEHG